LDHRDDFDGPPIELRARRRMQARYFSSGANANAVDGGNDVEERDPAHEHEDNAGVRDETPTEVHDAHIDLRERLVKQFEIRYLRNEVKWLMFPGKATELAPK
jgi:hypothetical protein